MLLNKSSGYRLEIAVYISVITSTAVTMKSLVRLTPFRFGSIVYGGLFMLLATLTTSCGSAPANSSSTSSLDPSSPEYQTKMQAAIQKAEECKAKGGNSKECAADIDTTMKAGANGIEAEAREKMQQYSDCKSQGGSDESCAKQTGVTKTN
jgi:hypothetical protein